MEQKKSLVMIVVLACCMLTILLHKSSDDVENGPMVVHPGGEPDHFGDMFGDTRLFENSDSNRWTGPSESQVDPSETESKVRLSELLANSLHVSSGTKRGNSLDVVDDNADDLNHEGSSIADIWTEEEVDNGTWKIFEEDYQKVIWKENKKGFNQWRTELELNGVNSRKSFLVTHDSVEEKQVLPFYLSTQQTYTVSEFFMSLIPKSSPYIKKSLGRCAVVGNSGNLRNSGCGKEIDGADYVFRCNIPPLVDFKNDVGLKTNLTTMNPSMMDTKRYGTISINRDPDLPYNLVLEPYHGVILLPCFSHFFYLRKCIKAIKQYYLKQANMTFLHPENFQAIWEYWKDRRLTNLPSTGFYIINVAATLCDSVDVFGFWPFDKTSLRSGQLEHVMYHYYEDGTWRPVHDMVGEFGHLFQLHRDGVLRMHLGNCTVR